MSVFRLNIKCNTYSIGSPVADGIYSAYYVCVFIYLRLTVRPLRAAAEQQSNESPNGNGISDSSAEAPSFVCSSTRPQELGVIWLPLDQSDPYTYMGVSDMRIAQ